MSNRYIRAGIETRIIQLGITDIPGFINDALTKEVDRQEKKGKKNGRPTR